MKDIEHIKKFMANYAIEPIEMVIICAAMLEWDIYIETSDDKEIVTAIKIVYPTKK